MQRQFWEKIAVYQHVIELVLNQSQKDLPALVDSCSNTSHGAHLHVHPKNILNLTTYFPNTPSRRIAVLTDICVSDGLAADGRFTVKYLLTSPELRSRIILAFSAGEVESIPSLVQPFFRNERLFSSAA